MKARLLSVIFFAASAICANAQKFVTYKEAADPVPVSARSVAAWQTVGKLQAQWVSADSLYSRSEVPVQSANVCKVER